MEIKRIIGADPVTGLNKQIRVSNFQVFLDKSVIAVNCVIELVSPTGVVVQQLSEFPYYREDADAQLDASGATSFPAKTDFTDLSNSQVGMAIQQMLQDDLNNLNL